MKGLVYILSTAILACVGGYIHWDSLVKAHEDTLCELVPESKESLADQMLAMTVPALMECVAAYAYGFTSRVTKEMVLVLVESTTVLYQQRHEWIRSHPQAQAMVETAETMTRTIVMQTDHDAFRAWMGKGKTDPDAANKFVSFIFLCTLGLFLSTWCILRVLTSWVVRLTKTKPKTKTELPFDHA
jgi:hypothetical protein